MSHKHTNTGYIFPSFHVLTNGENDNGPLIDTKGRLKDLGTCLDEGEYRAFFYDSKTGRAIRGRMIVNNGNAVFRHDPRNNHEQN